MTDGEVLGRILKDERVSLSDTGKKPVLGGPRAWLVWGIAVAFVVYYFSFQTGYAIVNPNVQKDIGLSAPQVALVAAVYTWVFALCQFFSGALLDRLGAGKIIPVSLALVTIGIFVFANAQSYTTLLLSQLIIAVGACTGFVGAGYIGGQWFGMAKFSFMFGLVQFAASFFSAFNQNLLSLALTEVPWRQLFNFIAIFGIALFILGALFIRNPTPVARASGSFVAFLLAVVRDIIEVAKIPHVWVASAFGALCFGVMLGLGVVWGPKLLAVRGFDSATANWSASLLWLGPATGCFLVPRWSDDIERRKLPIIVCTIVQVLALALLLYLPELNVFAAMVLCFAFGAGNAAHMLAFSTAADVVTPERIGTSAAIVNGIMFIVGGIMISRPGVRIGLGIDAGFEPKSLALTQYAAWPLMLAIVAALGIALVMRETYPKNVPV
jgi:MFS family permease